MKKEINIENLVLVVLAVVFAIMVIVPSLALAVWKTAQDDASQNEQVTLLSSYEDDVAENVPVEQQHS